MDFVPLLPPELIQKIFHSLSFDDLVSVSIVSVSWYIASNSSWLWRAAIKQSSSSDRFIKLSDLDKFNGISSSYDSDHSFNVEKPSTSRLPPINPWKLSLCRHNFVQRNLCGDRPNLKLARHEIAFDTNTKICCLNVNFASRSAQDGLYLPVIGIKPGEINKEFYLIRLDGVTKVIRLFTTVDNIFDACIDRHGVVWVERNKETEKVNYLPFVENFNSFQSRNSLFESDIHNLWVITRPHRFSKFIMDANHLAVCTTCGAQKQLKIWCRKTFELEFTLTPEADIITFNFNNGHFYLALSGVNDDINTVQMYDVKQNKLISVLNVKSQIEFIVFGSKYYAIVTRKPSNTLIYVCNIKNNNVMSIEYLRRNIIDLSNRVLNNRLWVDDDHFIYKHNHDLKVLNLVNWKIRNSLSFREYSVMDFELDVIDGCLLVFVTGRVDVWDWKLCRKMQQIVIPLYSSLDCNFFVLETRFVHVGETSVEVVGFW